MLAIIAGTGALPARLVAGLSKPPLICELEGAHNNLPDVAIRFRIEHLGSFINDLSANGVTEVCFAGSVHRPKLDPTHIDAATMPLVPRMIEALELGDDAALRTVISFFEEAGFEVRGAHQLMPELLPIAGVLTQVQPTKRHRRDVQRAIEVSTALAVADVGQALVVSGGQVLAVEALGGTDWMLASLAGDRRPDGPDGGLLYKAPKAEQERRIDMPVIGPETVAGARSAGLAGIVIEADGVMVIDLAQTVEAADLAGLFLWIRPK